MRGGSKARTPMKWRNRRKHSARSKWPKPVCCRESVFTAGSGSSIRSSIASRRKQTTWAERPALTASSSRWHPAGVRPLPVASQQDPLSQAAPGGCCWWEGQEVGKLLCAQSCYGPHLHKELTGVWTSKAWHSTSAVQTTLIRCVSVGLSGAWWVRSAAASWCRDMRRS